MKFYIIWENLPYLLQGLILTLKIALLVIFGGALLGIFIGVLRSSSIRPIKIAAAIYIEYIRGTPLLVVLFVVYFGLPSIIDMRFSAYQAAIIGFIIFIAAYIAEDVRSGLNSVPRGQIEAGLATGLHPVYVMVDIVLPQAIRRMIPTFFNQFVRLTKFTSVASIIGVIELTGSAGIINSREFVPFEIYLTIALAYFVVCYSLSLVGRYLNKRLAIET